MAGVRSWPSTEVFSASQLCPLAGRAPHREAGVRQASCEGTDLAGVCGKGVPAIQKTASCQPRATQMKVIPC